MSFSFKLEVTMTIGIDLGTWFKKLRHSGHHTRPQNLAQGQLEHTYEIARIDSEDTELKAFLLTLGCFPGERVTLISKVSDTYVIAVKDARYSIDRDLARAIIVQH